MRPKNDNSHIGAKIRIRKEALKAARNATVLDCFAGKGLMWSNFRLEKYHGYEIKGSENPDIEQGDNLKILPLTDLSEWALIDLDSWGEPTRQMEAIARNPTLRDGTVIVYTFIFGTFGRQSRSFFQDLEGAEVFQSHPSLSCRVADYLFEMKIRRMFGARKLVEIRKNDTLVKRYGFFIVDKKNKNV